MAESTEAQKRASRKWTKANVKQLSVGLRYGADDDIIDKLESVGNKAQYVKHVIREDMKRNG